MFKLKSSFGSENPFSNNYMIEVSGKKIAYTYIRKNACSSFKKMFKDLSPHVFSQEKPELSSMNKYHLDNNVKSIDSADYRVFIYRDPIERVLSVYKNKFIQNTGNADIFKSISEISKIDPFECSFENFVKKYVSKVPDLGKTADPHLWSLSDSIFRVNYNAVIEIDDLYMSMSKILGKEISDKYFKNKVNSSQSILPYSRTGNVSSCSASELNNWYLKTGEIPGLNNFLTEEVVFILKSVYENDYIMSRNFY